MKDINQIAETLVSLTVKEVNELAKIMKDEYGIEAIAPVQTIVSEQKVEEVEEKTSFDVILTNIGTTKLSVIKEVRTLTQLGLRECKELVETPSAVIKEGISKMQAEEFKARLEGVGASIAIK